MMEFYLVLWLVTFLLDFILYRPISFQQVFFQVDSCVPDLKVEWRNWLPSQALQSTRTAMQLANDYLNIAPVHFDFFSI